MTEKFTDSLKNKIKTDFIEGVIIEGERVFLSIEALAERHSVSRATIYRHSNPSKEDWQKQKNRFQTKLNEEIEENRLKNLAKDAIILDKNSLNIAQAMLQRVARRIARANEEEREQGIEALNASELRELSNVAEKAQKIGKLALGEASQITKVSADVSAPESYTSLIRHLEQIADAKARTGKHTIQ